MAGSDAWSCAVNRERKNRWRNLRIWFSVSPFKKLTRICRFIVIQNSVMKYMTSMGQKTGTLNRSKNVQKIAIVVDFVIAYQNLNSGSRRMNGRNSSLLRVGSAGPSGSSAERISSVIDATTPPPMSQTHPNLSLVRGQFSALRRQWTNSNDRFRERKSQCTSPVQWQF